MNIIKTFGNNVKKYRLQANISQEKLAEMSNLHRTYISDIERYERNVSLDSVQKIADALNIGPDKLLESTDDEVGE